MGRGLLIALAVYHLLPHGISRSAIGCPRHRGKGGVLRCGHAAAGVGFTGWRARPVWNVMVYSADEPPARRASVQVDGVTGEVLTVTEEPLVHSTLPDGEGARCGAAVSGLPNFRRGPQCTTR